MSGAVTSASRNSICEVPVATTIRARPHTAIASRINRAASSAAAFAIPVLSSKKCRFKVDGPSGARRRKNLHVNAVDVQEIEARRYIALNDFGSGRFQAFRELRAVKLGGEAIVVDAWFAAGFG
jgi:hypothetical protein